MNTSDHMGNSIGLSTAASRGVCPRPVATLTGAKCDLDKAGVTRTIGGDDITLTFPLIFDGTLSGQQNIYQIVIDESGAFAGWDLMGTWDISGP